MLVKSKFFQTILVKAFCGKLFNEFFIANVFENVLDYVNVFDSVNMSVAKEGIRSIVVHLESKLTL